MEITNVNIGHSVETNQLFPSIQKAAREMMPAYLMFAIGMKANEVNLALREDYFEHLRRHMAAAVVNLDELSVARVSKLVEDRALELMQAVNTTDPIACLYTIFYCILKAVDEGLITDVGSQPVLYAVLMINESEDMGFATKINTAWCKQKAGEMFSTVYYHGYF
jgi:hypothetical protein